MASILSVSELHRSFYGVHALKGMSLEVEEATVTGLIGPNGAGKTTLFNCISGAIRADSGEIVFRGENITKLAPHQITRRGLIRTYQIARGFPRLTVLENLLLYGRDQPGESIGTALFRRRSMCEREAQLQDKALSIARRLNLSKMLGSKASSLSGGQKKLLEIGRVLMAEPKLILFDEPMAGVNPSLIREIEEQLKAIAAEGITVVLIEHQMDAIAKLCQHVVVLADGQRLTEGTFEKVASNEAVQQAYMGYAQ